MPTAKNTTNDGIPNLSETLLETIQAISRIEKNNKKVSNIVPHLSSKRGKFKAKFSTLKASNLARFVNKFYPILPF